MKNGLDSLLAKIQGSDSPAPSTTTKTASANGAIDEAISKTLRALDGSTKVAAAEGGAPVGDLLKLAQEVRAADLDAEVKHAHLCGTSFADGMVERLGLYQGYAEQQAKTAAEADAARYDALNEFAKEYPAEFAMAAGQGYADAMHGATPTGQDKTAAEWDREFMERADAMHSLAMAHYFDGYQKAHALVGAAK